MMNEIIPNLYIGDYQDAKDRPKDFVSINVAHEHLDTLPESVYLPWLRPDGNRVAVDISLLYLIAENIDRDLKHGRKVLVNCNMGQERAPLTVVWYLIVKKGMTLDDAYKLVKEKRKQTLDRRGWIGD